MKPVPDQVPYTREDFSCELPENQISLCNFVNYSVKFVVHLDNETNSIEVDQDDLDQLHAALFDVMPRYAKQYARLLTWAEVNLIDKFLPKYKVLSAYLTHGYVWLEIIRPD